MRVMIIRHGKVLHNWKKWCTSAEFDKQCALYDKAPIDTESVDTVNGDIQKIYISDLDRTLQTAEKIFGDLDFERPSKINEVPIRSSFDTAVKMPLWFWNALGRLQWMMGSKRQPEKKAQTISRADQFVGSNVDRHEDCCVVTHGFFMHTLIKMMKNAGFRADKSRVKYRNAEIILLTNNQKVLR